MKYVYVVIKHTTVDRFIVRVFGNADTADMCAQRLLTEEPQNDNGEPYHNFYVETHEVEGLISMIHDGVSSKQVEPTDLDLAVERILREELELAGPSDDLAFLQSQVPCIAGRIVGCLRSLRG